MTTYIIIVKTRIRSMNELDMDAPSYLIIFSRDIFLCHILNRYKNKCGVRCKNAIVVDMERRHHQLETRTTDDELQAFYAMIVFLVCVVCAKEPEFSCEYCDKVYKQEGRYHAHLAKCKVKVDTDSGRSSSSSEISELLRQNREMMVLLQKQQETIQALVSQLVVSGP